MNHSLRSDSRSRKHRTKKQTAPIHHHTSRHTDSDGVGVIHGNGNLVIPFFNTGPEKHLITQSDLVEEAVLKAAAEEALELWKHKRDWIRRLLEDGAPIEPGARRAELKKTRPRMKLS